MFSSCLREQKIKEEIVEQKEIKFISLTNQQIKNIGIETEKIRFQILSSILKLNGKIEVPPQNMVSISAPLGGYLKSTKLLSGKPVTKGEVLGVIEDLQYIQLQQDYLTAKAQFELQKIEFQRQKDLNQSKATSDKVYEQTKASYQTQLIAIKSLEEKLKLIGIDPQKLNIDNLSKSINIYSPITGFVSAVNVNPGKYVNPNEVLFELVNPSDIHLSLTAFEKDIHKLAIGQRLIAYSNTNSEKKYTCEIILISRNIENNNSAKVHCHFKQYDNTLLPGMFMNAEVEWQGENTAILPEEAIVRYKNNHYAFTVLDNNKFQMYPVQIGKSENDFIEIMNAKNLSNLTFVTKGAYNLLMTFKNISED